jgi:TAZ zinc finger
MASSAQAMSLVGDVKFQFKHFVGEETSATDDEASSPPGPSGKIPISSKTCIEQQQQEHDRVVIETMMKKSRQAADYLVRLIHSRQCQGRCAEPNCKTIAKLVEHSMHCSARKSSSGIDGQNKMASCAISGCQTTKSIIYHFLGCRRDFKNAKAKMQKPPVCIVCSLAFKGCTDLGIITSQQMSMFYHGRNEAYWKATASDLEALAAEYKLQRVSLQDAIDTRIPFQNVEAMGSGEFLVSTSPTTDEEEREDKPVLCQEVVSSLPSSPKGAEIVKVKAAAAGGQIEFDRARKNIRDALDEAGVLSRACGGEIGSRTKRARGLSMSDLPTSSPCPDRRAVKAADESQVYDHEETAQEQQPRRRRMDSF